MSSGDEKAVLLIGGFLLAMILLGLIRGIGGPFLKILWLYFARRFVYPLESRLLKRLQDRATARAFNVPIEVVRIRRKADTGSD